MSRVLIVALAGVLLFGCYSAEQYSRMVEQRSVDPLVEMDVLFECATIVSQRRGLEIVQASRSMLRLVSAWEQSGELERRRLIQRVIYDDDQGPGIEIGWFRQRWISSEGEPDIGAPFHSDDGPSPWETVERNERDIAEEEAMSAEVRACWQDSFTMRYRR